MRRFQLIQYAAAAIASVGMMSPSVVMAADSAAPPALSATANTASIIDVSLGEAGMFCGQVVDGQGTPLAKLEIGVCQNGNEVASTLTDDQGYFAATGLQGGVYEVVAGGSSNVFRLWSAGASPPSATKRVLIVVGDATRGQCHLRNGRRYYNRGYSGPRVPGTITNGQVVIAGMAVAGLAAGITAVAISVHESKSGS